jgi:hypothetical protein
LEWGNKEKRAMAGVSIVINKKYKQCITNWNFINERIVSVESNIFGKRMSIVDVYAPTNSYPEKAKDQFWETFNNCGSDFWNKLARTPTDASGRIVCLRRSKP